MQEHEFLEDYEIGRWELNPRIYKILALSVALNLTTIFILGKTNLLQSKACDSPYVGKICQAFDMIYVGSKIFSGDEGYVVKDYNRTKIDDADVVWVSQDGAEPQLQYPEGYFYKENPESAPGDEFAVNENPILPPVDNSPIRPPSNNDSLMNRRPTLPKRNRKPVSGDLPDSILSGNNTDEKDPKGGGTDKPGNTDPATAKTDKPGEKDPANDAAAVESDPFKVEINKKPLQDFADETFVKWETKAVDLSQQFLVRMSGSIKENGRLDPERSKFHEVKGDPGMIIVAKRAIESVGDSGWLDYLSRLGVRDVDLVFAQNDLQLLAVVNSKLSSPQKAESVASGLRNTISLVLLAHNNGIKKLKDDEVQLLKAAKISSSRNSLTINFNLDKSVAQQMIDSRLREVQAKKLKEKDKNGTQTRPNGAADTFDGNKNSGK